MATNGELTLAQLCAVPEAKREQAARALDMLARCHGPSAENSVAYALMMAAGDVQHGRVPKAPAAPQVARVERPARCGGCGEKFGLGNSPAIVAERAEQYRVKLPGEADPRYIAPGDALCRECALLLACEAVPAVPAEDPPRPRCPVCDYRLPTEKERQRAEAIELRHRMELAWCANLCWGVRCPGPPVDWRARALRAEAQALGTVGDRKGAADVG